MEYINSLSSEVSTHKTNLAPYHLLFFSALLGSALYQSFVVTKIAFVTLPRTSFTTLNRKIFQVYFRGQTLLVLLTAITFPPHSISSLSLHKADWIPLAVAGATTLLNLVVYEPRTRKAMVDRIHQETRDARIRTSSETANVFRSNTNTNNNHTVTTPLMASHPNHQHHEQQNKPISEGMKRLNKIFSKNHAMSIHLNLISMISLIFYGFRLASRLKV